MGEGERSAWEPVERACAPSLGSAAGVCALLPWLAAVTAEARVTLIKPVSELAAKRGKGSVADAVVTGLNGAIEPFSVTGPSPGCAIPVRTIWKLSVAGALAETTSHTATPVPFETPTGA